MLQLLLLINWLAALDYLRQAPGRLWVLQFRLVQRCSPNWVRLLLTEVLGLLRLRLGRRRKLLVLLLKLIVLRMTVLRRLPLRLLTSLLLLIIDVALLL